MNNKLVSIFGNRAAVLVAVETILFAVSLIVGLTIKNSTGMIAGYIISIFLAATVIVMMAAAYMRAPDERRILGLLALSSAIVYAPLCMSTYFIQLAVVAPNSLGLSPGVLRLITFVPGAPLFALDMLGYVFLCLSTFAIAFTLTDPRDKALRVLCIVHGALAIPTLAAPIISGLFLTSSGQSNDIGSWVLLFWCALFAPIPILLASVFRREVDE